MDAVVECYCFAFPNVRRRHSSETHYDLCFHDACNGSHSDSLVVRCHTYYQRYVPTFVTVIVVVVHHSALLGQVVDLPGLVRVRVRVRLQVCNQVHHHFLRTDDGADSVVGRPFLPFVTVIATNQVQIHAASVRQFSSTSPHTTFLCFSEARILNSFVQTQRHPRPLFFFNQSNTTNKLC